MTEMLKRAIAQVEQLPEQAQDELAVLIQAALDEKEWDMLVSSPDGQAALAQLVAEARQDIADGNIEEVEGDTFA